MFTRLNQCSDQLQKSRSWFLVGSPHMDWNRLTAFALFSGCKYPHQTVHQLKLTHLLM
ncbi:MULTISPECIES: hypothetical protein [Bacillus]|uniref:hypothetical protein n=1 Tax=Bacillus TaxID=1386 RepID=UPI001319E3EA|nr:MULTISPECIES: hypothetical protein [Bacillus]MCP9019417.1 hypothetical protein [Bacillus velezensis]MDE5153537.1 hypothetical protein [Bacillus amyloliquefaciens]MDK2560673.1 hypothetical protein [Bacillus amyloliquefaciens]NCT28632.1 hypothetical protein [Bacillus velezensis]QTG84147.1 hypothetical protein J4048_14440 [Bacillus amyloliquefaciens]